MNDEENDKINIKILGYNFYGQISLDPEKVIHKL